jgi:hypothetical protein
MGVLLVLLEKSNLVVVSYGTYQPGPLTLRLTLFARVSVSVRVQVLVQQTLSVSARRGQVHAGRVSLAAAHRSVLIKYS